MYDEEHRLLVRQLCEAIAWEIGAQLGVRRPLAEIPPLVADILLDLSTSRRSQAWHFPVLRECTHLPP